jgi:hypothetical protein
MSEPNLSSIDTHYKNPIYKYHQYQGKTNNCGPTCLAISMNAFIHEFAFNGEHIANELNHWSKHFPKLIIPRISDWVTFPWGLVQYLKYQNIPGKWSLFGSTDKLIENIKNETITMVIIGEPVRWTNGKYDGWSHIKVLYGYSPGNFFFVDPAYQKNTGINREYSDSGIYRQSEEEFQKLWKNMLMIFIELG